MTCASSMHEAGQSKPVLWGNPEGWGGEGGGRGIQDVGTRVYLWLIHVDVWQKPPQYCKVIILQLKLINFLKTALAYRSLTHSVSAFFVCGPELCSAEG